MALDRPPSLPHTTKAPSDRMTSDIPSRVGPFVEREETGMLSGSGARCDLSPDLYFFFVDFGLRVVTLTAFAQPAAMKRSACAVEHSNTSPP